jgi:hypothetical protein
MIIPENINIIKHLDDLEKQDLIGIDWPPEINLFKSINEELFVHEISYVTYLKKPCFDIPTLNEILKGLMPKDFKFSDSPYRSQKNVVYMHPFTKDQEWGFNGSKYLTIGYLEFRESIDARAESCDTDLPSAYTESQDNMVHCWNEMNYSRIHSPRERKTGIFLFPDKVSCHYNISSRLCDSKVQYEYIERVMKESIKSI